MTLLSPAKINLSLRILGKRPDGFHEIETRLVRLTFGDTVEIEHLGTGTSVNFTCSDATVPADESNLALKALRAFESRTGTQSSWRIHLEKRIPHGAGLGGGSSNAATVLRAANELSGNPLSLPQLLEIAAQIGTVAETLSRTLATLKSRRIIAVAGSAITILDEDALHDLAENG